MKFSIKKLLVTLVLFIPFMVNAKSINVIFPEQLSTNSKISTESGYKMSYQWVRLYSDEEKDNLRINIENSYTDSIDSAYNSSDYYGDELKIDTDKYNDYKKLYDLITSFNVTYENTISEFKSINDSFKKLMNGSIQMSESEFNTKINRYNEIIALYRNFVTTYENYYDEINTYDVGDYFYVSAYFDELTLDYSIATSTDSFVKEDYYEFLRDDIYNIDDTNNNLGDSIDAFKSDYDEVATKMNSDKEKYELYSKKIKDLEAERDARLLNIDGKAAAMFYIETEGAISIPTELGDYLLYVYVSNDNGYGEVSRKYTINDIVKSNTIDDGGVSVPVELTIVKSEDIEQKTYDETTDNTKTGAFVSFALLVLLIVLVVCIRELKSFNKIYKV